MNRIGEHKYYVVKFLENPFKETERVSCGYVCVPKSWVTWCSPEDSIVRVWYPTQDPSNTEIKVRKREKKSDQWESFLSVLKYSTDIYEQAKIYILHMVNSENNKEDRTPLSAKVKEKTSKTTSSVIQNEATVTVHDTKGWSVASKSANTITLKRAPADSDKPAHRERSRVNEPSKSVDEVAGPSSQTFELRSNNQTLTHTNSSEDLCIEETPVVKSNDRNSTKKKQIVNQNASKANHSVDPKSVVQLPIFVKCCKLILQLQKCLSNPLVKYKINKAFNTDNSQNALIDDIIASASSDATVQTPKLNEEKRNEKQIEENGSDDDNCDEVDFDDDDDINKHSKTKNNTLPIIKEAVPPKYVANDSHDDDCDDNNRDEDDCDDDDRDKDDCDDDDDDDRNEHTKTKNNPLPIIKEVVPAQYDANELEEHDENNYNNVLLKTKSPQRIKKFPPKLDNGGDHNERRKKEQIPRLPKAFVLPPEYDANDSRWTLKYREPAPGLRELVKHSGVYVDASRLRECINMTGCSDKLCLLLLSEVFTSSALRTCSWTGKRASGCYSQGTNVVRPGLDAHAREVLLKFLTGYGNEPVKWRISNRGLMTRIMTRKMVAMRK